MSTMEFWGVEVKAGETLVVTPDNEYIIHLSQAAVPESKKDKGNESVPLWVKIGDQKILLGTLGTLNTPQLAFDLVFEKEFELSHSWKNGSVYFCGYQSNLPEEEYSESDMDSDEEELLPVVKTENAKQPAGNALNAVKSKPDTIKLKPKAEEASKGSKADDHSDEDDSGEDNSDDEDDESESDDGSEEGMSVDESDDDDEDESESEDEETPKKVEADKGKKRVKESATKTPVPSKKIKTATPQETDGKKGVHTATPHPAKNAAKTAANGSNVKTPKSVGQFSCKSCDRSFGSDGALQSHSKAKHGK